MKLLQGLPLLALWVAVVPVGVDGAFWNRKQSNEDDAPTAEPPGAYAAGEGNADRAVRSLSSYQAPVPVPVTEPIAVPVSAKPGRRAHFLIQDQESADALVQLAESRQLREQEIRVLTRLHTEKEGELGRMNERLQERFGISSEADYQYDNETKSLFLLLPRPGAEAAAGANPEDLFEKQLHMTLREKKTEVEFVRLISAKKITASELQVLKLLLKEKYLERDKVNQMLEERFAISPDKHYEYDAPSRTLFEVLVTTGDVSGTTLGR